jgi:hypothetical protein
MSDHTAHRHTGSEHAAAAAHAPLFGVMAEYADEDAVVIAAKQMYGLGYRKMDGYSPFPVHGLDDAIGRKRTKLPILVLAAGLTGAIVGFGMQTFAAAIHYPQNIAGRPYISWPMQMPIAFELTILFASLTATFAMLGLNGFPMPYHPTFNVPAFERASNNGFFLCVESDDPQFDVQKLKDAFESTGAKGVYEVPE